MFHDYNSPMGVWFVKRLVCFSIMGPNIKIGFRPKIGLLCGRHQEYVHMSCLLHPHH